MCSVMRGIVVAAVLTVTFSASAGLGPNGLGPNGLGPNGLGPNGLGPNGLGPNGLGPNGLGPNGLGPNGLGPNGLGPNGLGPNGLDVNGLGPNGLGPNGLGPDGLVYVISPAGVALDEDGDVVRDGAGNPVPVSSTFSAWFDADPVGAAQYMRYFARCAYDGETGIAWLDSRGKTWVWTGQYGLAMTSLRTIVTEPGLGEVRGRMTREEGKWVSGCLLAHVNTKGTHQYLSVRLYGHRAPSAEASSALATSAGEDWTFRETFGAFFGDLFAVGADGTPLPVKYACSNGTSNPFRKKVENALGRTCDLGPCTYLDDGGTERDVLTAYLGMCGPKEDPTDPVTGEPPRTISWAGVTYDPLQVLGPSFQSIPRGAIDVASCSSSTPPAWCTAADSSFSVPLDLLGGQRVECLDQECVGNTSNEFSEKLVGLRGGQAVDVVHKGSQPAPAVLDEAYTAIVRYTKGRTGAANLWVSARDGGWRDVTSLATGAGPDVWSATGTSDRFEWLQVYPVHPYVDPVDGAPSIRMRVSGAAKGTSCTGTILQKGDGEAGACRNPLDVYFDWKHLKVVCRERSETLPACRGELVLDWRDRRWGWFCAFGGPAIRACTAADAPELDTAAFVPGKPWCMPASAKTFVGVCR
jgi:hypothetical protein